jgi:hypothetical protein
VEPTCSSSRNQSQPSRQFFLCFCPPLDLNGFFLFLFPVFSELTEFPIIPLLVGIYDFTAGIFSFFLSFFLLFFLFGPDPLPSSFSSALIGVNFLCALWPYFIHLPRSVFASNSLSPLTHCLRSDG